MILHVGLYVGSTTIKMVVLDENLYNKHIIQAPFF